MNSLKDYFNKTVKIVDIDNEKFIGYVETYTPAVDSDEEVEEIAIKPKGSRHLIGFNENEIKSIEVI